MRESNKGKVRKALESAGVIFLGEGENSTGGQGVRLAASEKTPD